MKREILITATPQVVSPGLVDAAPKAYAAGERFAEDIAWHGALLPRTGSIRDAHSRTGTFTWGTLSRRQQSVPGKRPRIEPT